MDPNNFNYSVSWSDFSHLPSRPQGETEDAHIHTRMNLNYQMGGRGRASIISSADMDILIVSANCWAVTGAMSSNLLVHEQGHYDVQALVAREFLNSLLSLSAPSDHALRVKIRQLETKFQGITNTVNRRYDTATNHSVNTSVQQTWNKKIAAVKQNPNGTVNDLP